MSSGRLASKIEDGEMGVETLGGALLRRLSARGGSPVAGSVSKRNGRYKLRKIFCIAQFCVRQAK
jgi:hypothetical protein